MICVYAEHERKITACLWLRTAHFSKQTNRLKKKAWASLTCAAQETHKKDICSHLTASKKRKMTKPKRKKKTLTGFWKFCDYSTQRDKTHTAPVCLAAWVPLHKSLSPHPKKKTQTHTDSTLLCGRKFPSEELAACRAFGKSICNCKNFRWQEKKRGIRSHLWREQT